MGEVRWNEVEFMSLLQHLPAADDELSRMTGRSVGAVQTVKAGLREYVRGNTENTLLSGLMRDLLRGREHYLRVPF